MSEESLYEHMRFVADPRQGPMRIDKFLFERIEGISRSKIQAAATEGYIRVNDSPVKSNYKVRPHDVITVVMPTEPKERIQALPEEMDLDITYEDDHIIIIHKPPGMVVHPGVGNRTGTLVNGLVHYMGKNDMPTMPGNDIDRPGIVHRIDKNTSGLMVVAKNEEAMAGLAKQFFDHTIEREYVALVWGEPDPLKGTIEGNIGRHPNDNLKMYVFPENEAGKHAVTHYETLEDLYYVSLVKCRLETGRTHQIRVHFSHIGNPVFSDEKYGGREIKKGTVFSKYKQFVHNCFNIIPRHALHAKSLGFIHPHTNEYVRFDSELPDDMTEVLEKWKHYVTHQKSRN
ncbi:MAG: RluA family pseudouridine synthase [Saprospiraceae bacterium]|nr:RluA family pseudouridine synthase [Saprospiraceae bacterium]